MIIDEIESIEEIGDDTVYDIINLETFEGNAYENEGHFIIDGLIVHNCIPEFIARRDDLTQSWKATENKEIIDLLSSTYGIIVYQEQLQAMWQKFAGFTAPEAEAARKAVAKKWVEKLKPIEELWIKGATKTIGKTAAMEWWDKMVAFGRYAFNSSHSVAYVMIAYWCLWLKAHFPAEWWATVMSYCDHDKLVKYMNVARKEGVKFGAIDIENLTTGFTVDPQNNVVALGLSSLKGIGDKTALKLSIKRKYTDIDDFISVHGKQKATMERLILLGAFRKYHSNIKATWMWYQYEYCTGKEITELKNSIKSLLLKDWTKDKIEAERSRQIKEYRKLYPNRHKIPKKISQWSPKADDSRENIMALYDGDDYTQKELLAFEKQYLGYYWHSPMELYKTRMYTSIDDAKENKDSAVMEVVIDNLVISKTKRGTTMGRLTVTDGLQTATVIIWQDQLEKSKGYLKVGNGVKMKVTYDPNWNSFTVYKNSIPMLLECIDGI